MEDSRAGLNRDGSPFLKINPHGSRDVARGMFSKLYREFGKREWLEIAQVPAMTS